jgi:hypothetical protein
MEHLVEAELRAHGHDVVAPDPADDESTGPTEYAGPNVPTKIVLCTEDRFVPPAFFRRLVAERLNITPDVASGHCVALSERAQSVGAGPITFGIRAAGPANGPEAPFLRGESRS